MEEMTKAEKAFVEKWGIERKNWHWGQHFKTTFLYVAVPMILMVDLFNFFVIGDLSFAFISLRHVYNISFDILVYGVLWAFTYNLLMWNSKEIRFKAILRKHRLKKK